MKKSRNVRVNGVLGGLSDAMGIDPFWLRAIYGIVLALSILTFQWWLTIIMVVIYIVLAKVMDKPDAGSGSTKPRDDTGGS